MFVSRQYKAALSAYRLENITLRHSFAERYFISALQQGTIFFVQPAAQKERESFCVKYSVSYRSRKGEVFGRRLILELWPEHAGSIEKIKPDDVIIGLASGGLQTNGYTLARRVLFDVCGLTVNDLLPGTRTKIGDALLATHRSFLKPVKAVLAKMPINGRAHITGGGFVDNIPRVLPTNCRAVINRLTWKVPAIFNFIEKAGKIEREEMYRVFNMGIGFVLIVDKNKAQKAYDILKAAKAQPTVIGGIVKGAKGVSFRDEAE